MAKEKRLTLREMREETGLSQSKFGQILGIPSINISRWETGKSKPPEYVETLVRYRLESLGLLGPDTLYPVPEPKTCYGHWIISQTHLGFRIICSECKSDVGFDDNDQIPRICPVCHSINIKGGNKNDDA